jgi:hypothetical protein
LKKRFKDDSSDGPLGTKVPALEKAASSPSSLETENLKLETYLKP